MATWAQFGLQDASSPLMEELTYFHDYALIVLTLITILVFYGLVSLLVSSSTNRFFLEGQELETIWTVIPALILILIALPSLQLLYLMDEVKDPFLTIKAIGHQWYWRYEYTDYKDLEFDSYMVPTSDISFGNPRLLEVDNRWSSPCKTPYEFWCPLQMSYTPELFLSRSKDGRSPRTTQPDHVLCSSHRTVLWTMLRNLWG